MQARRRSTSASVSANFHAGDASSEVSADGRVLGPSFHYGLLALGVG
jgi:hypothetical protein